MLCIEPFLDRTAQLRRAAPRRLDTADQRKGNPAAGVHLDFLDAQLLDAEYVEFDGLDEGDALARGFRLEEVQPPQGDDEEALRRRMFVRLGGIA